MLIAATVVCVGSSATVLGISRGRRIICGVVVVVGVGKCGSRVSDTAGVSVDLFGRVFTVVDCAVVVHNTTSVIANKIFFFLFVFI